MVVKILSSPVANALAISIGLWTFALFYRGSFALQLLAAVSLLVTAILIVKVLITHNEVLLQKGLWQWPSPAKKVLVLSFGISGGLAIWYRYTEQMPLLPVSFEWFVILSVLIGATEELIFRGVVQGEASYWHPTGAVYLSAFAFAGYKTLLFVQPSPQNQTNLATLFIFTFLAGILLGYTRKNTGSIWPCLVAHGIFDLVVYAETASSPWWVW